MPNKNEQIKELIELNDELEDYFRNTIIPQLFIDADLRLRKFTPPAMKQFSLTEGDVGKSIIEIKENFRFPTIIENIREVINSKEILEKEIQTTDFRWYQMNIIPYISVKTNTTNGVIVTFVEITLRIRDLKDLEKLISDYESLLDTLSHDFRTPFTSLVLAVNRLKKFSDDRAEFNSLLQILENGIKKMQTLITELTDARKNDHQYKADEELVNFEHIIDDVRLILSENIKDSDAIIKCNIRVDEITFSRRKLRSIIYNLVNNAIKFKASGRKPEVSITTELDDEFIRLTVRDNGIGMERAKVDAIFSKFFRIQNSIEGTGIGLYLVKEIVTNAGGKIEVESELGKGSAFKIYLKN